MRTDERVTAVGREDQARPAGRGLAIRDSAKSRASHGAETSRAAFIELPKCVTFAEWDADTPSRSTVPVRLSVVVQPMGRPAGTSQPRGRGPRAAATTAGRVPVVLYVTLEHHERIHAQAVPPV